ncbi:hypothetical protein BT69DRAFT_127225 [Atractiella rhizophila]|nr:hypothetical protein BT69DRAFT_127225 [Atractiella rhizophila]
MVLAVVFSLVFVTPILTCVPLLGVVDKPSCYVTTIKEHRFLRNIPPFFEHIQRIRPTNRFTSIMISSQPAFQQIPIIVVENEKGELEKASQCLDGEAGLRHEHHKRSKSAFVTFFAVLLFVLTAASWLLTDWLYESTMGRDMELQKRQSDGSSGNNNDNVFIDKKYYLIVIFVGLLLVILAAIMVSAWCCQGVFRNPCCCPCYLCACCGCLSILECIGCGLCCEGLSE